jgi:hypothetical protein
LQEKLILQEKWQTLQFRKMYSYSDQAFCSEGKILLCFLNVAISFTQTTSHSVVLLGKKASLVL